MQDTGIEENTPLMAGYVRLSKEDAGKQTESESISNQKALLQRYAKERGWRVYRIYVDEDYSGIDRKRPAFNELLQDAQARRFQIVACKTQSRFTRDMEAVEKYIHHKFVLWGIRFISIADNADTAVKGNKKARQINGLINEWYLEDLSENVKMVLDHKRASGSYIGSFPLYGYQRDPGDHGHLVPDPIAAEVVRQIFGFYLQGWGKHQITKWLNREGILCPAAYKREKYKTYHSAGSNATSNQWNPTSVSRILQERMYVGDLVQGRAKKVSYKSEKLQKLPPEKWIIVPATHEAIIDRQVFLTAQEIRGQRVYESHSGTGSAHALTGKVRCSSCGSAMHKYQMTYRGTTKQYLRCKRYSNAHESCTSHSIRLDRLEEEICRQLRGYIGRYYTVKPPEAYLQENRYARKINAIRQESGGLVQKLRQQGEAKRAMYTDKAAGILSAAEYVAFSRGYDDEITRVETRLETLRLELETLERTQTEPAAVTRRIEQTLRLPTLTRRLAMDFIDYVEIGEKDTAKKTQPICVHWLF